ncbi:hypothetical protein TNCV_484551 [Trichonephila clavipes]|nr:hypothetical protein TNCV_484551 [Trichonephila clavipes]
MILCVAELLERLKKDEKIPERSCRKFDIAHSVVSPLWKSFKTTECVLDNTGGHESRFSLSSDCRFQTDLTREWYCLSSRNIQEKDRYPTCSIMVWASIMINGRTRLHVVANGTMTGQRYIDEVVLPHVRLFRGAVGDKFCFYGRQRNMSSNTRSSGLSRQRGYSTSFMGQHDLQILTPLKRCGMLWGGKLLVETILRQTRTPSSVHSQRNGINCLNSCWIMLCKVWYDVWNVASHSTAISRITFL